MEEITDKFVVMFMSMANDYYYMIDKSEDVRQTKV